MNFVLILPNSILGVLFYVLCYFTSFDIRHSLFDIRYFRPGGIRYSIFNVFIPESFSDPDTKRSRHIPAF